MLRLVGIWLGIILLIGAFSYGAWQFQRWWHYTWGYEMQVRDTVCEMVKPEYLKDPSKC